MVTVTSAVVATDNVAVKVNEDPEFSSIYPVLFSNRINLILNLLD